MEEMKQLRKFNNAIFNYFSGMPIREIELKDYIEWVEKNFNEKEVSNGKFLDNFVKKYLQHGDEKLRAVIHKNFSEMFRIEGYAWVLFSLAWLTHLVNNSENRSILIRLDKFLQINVISKTISLENFKLFYSKFIKVISTHCVNDVYSYMGLDIYQQFYNWCYSDRIINHYIRERVHAQGFENEIVDLDYFFEGEHAYLTEENRIRDRLYEIYRFGPRVAEPVVVKAQPEPVVITQYQFEEFEDDTTADKEQFANII
jgi:hypothetical protein